MLEYFDAHLIGLTATPSKQTLGFFNGNLVMEYPRTRAVADGVNVDGQVYRIRTQITERGSTVDAGYFVDKRDRLTRAVRWEQLDEDFAYTGTQLDRDVVAESQIRTVIRTFRDKLFTDLFPGRTEVPKTLVFAKDDSHAEDIVRIIREEFGKGNEFCQKITYRVTGVDAEDLIAAFRNSYHPRIAVTVDMISTGTDIKPLEVLLFMRPVRSRVLFEQMLGRGTRVISATDLQAVTPDARTKTHFVIVDAVGVVEQEKADTQTLERKRTVSFEKLLESVAWGARDADTLTSLAGRLARLERALTEADRAEIAVLTGGRTLRDLANALLDAVDPDCRGEVASPGGGDQGGDQGGETPPLREWIERATAPFDDPQLRSTVIAIHRRAEQVIDRVSIDRVTEAAYSAEDTERARATVESFRQFIEAHRDEITALQMIYGRPYAQRRLTYRAGQGAGRPAGDDAAQLDDRIALVGLRAVGERQGERRGDAARADRPGVAGAPRGAARRRAGALPAAGEAALRIVAGRPGGCRAEIHRDATLVAGQDRRAHRRQPGDDGGRFRHRRILRPRRADRGAQTVRPRVARAAGRVERGVGEGDGVIA